MLAHDAGDWRWEGNLRLPLLLLLLLMLTWRMLCVWVACTRHMLWLGSKVVGKWQAGEPEHAAGHLQLPGLWVCEGMSGPGMPLGPQTVLCWRRESWLLQLLYRLLLPLLLWCPTKRRLGGLCLLCLLLLLLLLLLVEQELHRVRPVSLIGARHVSGAGDTARAAALCPLSSRHSAARRS